MKINKIELTNFRGFKGKHEIDLHPELNVFVGVNGSGKTTILDAIAGIFRILISRTMAGVGVNFETDRRREINISAIGNAHCSMWLNHKALNDINGGFKISKNLTKKHSWEEFGYFDNEGIEYIKNEINSQKVVPLLSYFSVERTNSKISFRDTDYENGKSSITQTDAWDGALQQTVNFTHFFYWFRRFEDIENEMRLNVKPDYKDTYLEAIRNAIEKILDGFSDLRVRRLPPYPDFVIKKEQTGEILSINNQLSHGEKTMLALVGDLALRLAIANPQLKNPLQGEGVVLIDEIDLHLHPKWQKTIVKKLREVFPKIQFILTTHSPLIISQLKAENIILLENNQCIPLEKKGINSYGLTIEDVLVKIQGTTHLLPKEVRNEFSKLFDLIEADKLEEAKVQYSKLERIVEPTHPELLKGDTDIKIKELMK